MRSQARPISRACSVTGILAELPTTMALDSRFTAVRRMASQRSFAATTAKRTGLPSFSATERTLVEEKLFDGAEKLIGREIVLTGDGAAKKPDVQHDNLRLSSLGAAYRGLQVIEGVVSAHRDNDVAGMHSHVGSQREVGGLVRD